jgi:hypothetical protein
MGGDRKSTSAPKVDLRKRRRPGRLKMGERKRKLSKTQRFLADHPICCFCGGRVAATERDLFQAARFL